MQKGLGRKVAARILTVDPATRRIEGTLVDGAMVQIKAQEISTVFRWPLEGEVWTIRQDDGFWILDSRIENPEDGYGDVATMKAGETKITGDTNIAGNLVVNGSITVLDSTSSYITAGTYSTTRKWTTPVGNGTDTTFDLVHDLNTKFIDVRVIEAADPGEPVFDDIWKRLDANTIRLTFAVPPTTNQYLVTVFG